MRVGGKGQCHVVEPPPAHGPPLPPSEGVGHTFPGRFFFIPPLPPSPQPPPPPPTRHDTAHHTRQTHTIPMRAPALLLAALLAAAATASAKQDANTVYVLMAKSAVYDPKAPGKLVLTGVSSTIAGIGKDDDDSIVGRVPTTSMFGPKKTMPIFANGSDIIVDGKGPAGAEKRMILAVAKPAFNAASNELKFESAAPIDKEGALDGVVDDVLERTPAALKADTSKPVKLEDVVVTVDAYVPHAKAAIKAAKAKATNVSAVADAAVADAAAAPAPADAAAAPAAPAAKPGPKPPKPPPKPASPQSRRRLAQTDGPGKCGVCRYADKKGACQDVPSSATCDGIVGSSDGFDCGTCSYYTLDYFYGYCSDATGMAGC